jgi:Ankyrin repeats (3 copies)
MPLPEKLGTSQKKQIIQPRPSIEELQILASEEPPILALRDFVPSRNIDASNISQPNTSSKTIASETAIGVLSPNVIDLLCSDNVQIIKTMLNETNIDIQDKRGYTALMYAVSYDSNDTVRYLLTQGANPFKNSNYNESACSIALREYHIHYVNDFVQGRFIKDQIEKYKSRCDADIITVLEVLKDDNLSIEQYITHTIKAIKLIKDIVLENQDIHRDLFGAQSAPHVLDTCTLAVLDTCHLEALKYCEVLGIDIISDMDFV